MSIKMSSIEAQFFGVTDEVLNMSEPLTYHAMNVHRCEAFRTMLVVSHSRGQSTPFTTYFVNEVMSMRMAHALEDLGWLTICPGYRGRPSTLTLTDVGEWILSGVTKQYLNK